MKVPEKIDLSEVKHVLNPDQFTYFDGVFFHRINNIIDYLENKDKQFNDMYNNVATLWLRYEHKDLTDIDIKDNHEEHLKLRKDFMDTTIGVLSKKIEKLETENEVFRKLIKELVQEKEKYKTSVQGINLLIGKVLKPIKE